MIHNMCYFIISYVKLSEDGQKLGGSIDNLSIYYATTVTTGIGGRFLASYACVGTFREIHNKSSSSGRSMVATLNLTEGHNYERSGASVQTLGAVNPAGTNEQHEHSPEVACVRFVKV